MISKLKLHLENTSNDVFEKEWEEVEPYSDIGLTVDDFIARVNYKFNGQERVEAKEMNPESYERLFENGSYHPNEKTVIECNDKMIN